MTFKWPGTPSPRASRHELADHAELICWRQSGTSTTALSHLLGRLEDNDYSDGGVPEEEETDQVAEDAFREVERRQEACRDGYPFAVGEQGYTLKIRPDAANHKHIVYKYLLLATRLNMDNNRVHADIDGTQLFEELAAETAREYFGARARSLVFGTAAVGNSFVNKVNYLCEQIKEGDGFPNPNGATPRARDGKLDVVVWKQFTDDLPGKLIAFGQCKTGTQYRDTITQLQPDAFCDKWFLKGPAVSPIRMFLVSEALPRGDRSNWYDLSRDAGLLFDRCRIVDYCDGLCEDVLAKMKAWTSAAAQATGLP